MTAPDWNKQASINNKTVLAILCRTAIMVLRLGHATRKPVHPDWLPLQFLGNHARVMMMIDKNPTKYKGYEVEISAQCTVHSETGECLDFSSVVVPGGAANLGGLRMRSYSLPHKVAVVPFLIDLWESSSEYRAVVMSIAHEKLLNDCL